MVPNIIVTQVPMVLAPIRVRYSKEKECQDRWVERNHRTEPGNRKVDVRNNLLLVKGAVPGPKKSMVTIKETVKCGK